MSYVENQGVYAVNCASLDEVKVVQLQNATSTLKLRLRKRGTKLLGSQLLRSTT